MSGRGSTDSPLEVLSNGTVVAVTPVVGAVVKVMKKATTCACGREGKHYPETAMDVIIPGTPEKINTLLFASGFIKEFMSENQKVLGEILSCIHLISLTGPQISKCPTGLLFLLVRRC